jgi:nitroreductase
MNETLQHLHNRNSAPRLIEPGPDAQVLQHMFSAALRAPDHAWLQPRRFLVVAGEARAQLGQVFLRALLASNPEADEAARFKAENAPLRAPLMIVVICCLCDHPKVPHQEQILSAGCAAHALLLAGEAQDIAGIWRTGSYAEDPAVAAELGLTDAEQIIGFLYFGTRDGRAKPLPERKVDNYVSYWTA